MTAIEAIKSQIVAALPTDLLQMIAAPGFSGSITITPHFENGRLKHVEEILKRYRKPANVA